MPNSIYLVDGAMDFSGGVHSGKVPLLASESNPNGLRRDQLAWASNATMRGGAIQQRWAWKFLTTIADGSSLYQGGILYAPRSSDPFFVFSIGGRIYRCDALAGDTPTDLSAASGLTNPATEPIAYFCQAEEFLIIQAGDNSTLPLIWDNHFALRRSHGITGITTPGDPNINEIPAATVMDYYQKRIWYAQYETVSAGDIVKGPTGTAFYGKRDSVLKVTENPTVLAGDGFTVPAYSGSIRALAHAVNLDKTLGEGPLFIFTRKDVYSLDVPVTRADWTTSNEVAMWVAQKRYGTPAHRSVVNVNGDLFYRTMEPGIRSLAVAVRDFKTKWVNTPISREMNRVLSFDDRSLLRYASGMLWQNRLWQTSMPIETEVGVAHQAISVLDFDKVSGLEESSSDAPNWEGVYEGLRILDLFVGDFGGRERAFAAVHSTINSTIELWELTDSERFENADTDKRVDWLVETASFPFGNAFQLKELQGMWLWLDRMYGEVDVTVYWRPDSDPCWYWWARFQDCFARTSCEDLVNPICYPLTTYSEGWRMPITLPHPPKDCQSNGSRPAFHGGSFQLKFVIKGFARIRGFILFATPIERGIFDRLVCAGATLPAIGQQLLGNAR